MRFKHLLLPIMMSTALVACGGGGGGGSSSSDNSSQSSANTEPATVSGSITKDTSTASASLRTAAATQDLDAQVKIVSYDNKGNEVDKTSAVGNDDYTTDELFSAQVDLSKDGGYVIVRVYQDDFTSFEKRIDFDTPADIDVQAEIQAVTMLTAMPGSAISATGQSYPAYQFAIMKQPDGTTTAVAGADRVQIAKAAGSTTELEITVPANSPGVDSSKEMTAKLRNYDPSDPTQADNFPGKYEDASGKRLVSVAFDYASVSQDGTNLGDLANGATGTAAAATTPTIVRRAIPANSCDVLAGQGDSDSGTAGFNVPVYTYNPNSGVWELLGQGTVEDTSQNPIAVGSFTATDCKNNGNVLRVEISNDKFTHTWWNLDYPLTFSAPEQFCANVKMVNNAGDPITGTAVQLYDDDGRSFQEKYAFTAGDGTATLDTVRLDGSNDTQAKLRFWGYGSGVYESQAVTLTQGDASSCGGSVQTLTVQRADVCRVSGHVVDDTGADLADNVVWATASGTSALHFATGYTDDQGNYSLKVLCNEPYSLWAGYTIYSGATATFNVDGSAAGDEASDNGTSVGLKELTVTNNGPWVGAITAEESASVGVSSKIEVTGIDFEGDYPISYSFSYPDGSCASSGEVGNGKCTGTITEAEANSGDPVIEQWNFSNDSNSDGDGVGCITMGTMTASDSKGKTSVFTYAYAVVGVNPDTCTP